MEEVIHLFVEVGPEKGRRISIPPGGGRIGRSEANDIVLQDESLSRFHCRVYFKPDQRLHVSDLGSTNETLVNHKAIQDTELYKGDRIEIGETEMVVINDHLEGTPERPAPASPPPVDAPPAAAPAEGAPVDLGFKGAPASPPSGSKPWGKLLFALVLLVVFAGAVVLMRSRLRDEPSPELAAPVPDDLAFYYEKVQASRENIFRYELTLEDNRLVARVDNLSDGRHVTRESEISEGDEADLVRALETTGFFDLQPAYQGLASEVWDSWDLQATIGRRTHRVQVVNRVEPDSFKALREQLEAYAQNELGLVALALPRERLLQLAQEAVLQGQKYFGEREVRYENLSRAIQAFDEAQWYLETIEPKPDYYEIAVAGLEECRRMLTAKHDDQLFLAERAIKLRDWETAARHLRTIIEMIPNRSDERHEKAQKKLIDVERRLRK